MKPAPFIRRLARDLLYLTKNLVNDPAELNILSEGLVRLTNEVNGKIRQQNAKQQLLPEMFSFDQKNKLQAWVLEDRTPWADITLEKSGIPGMITDEERQYYEYIGQFFSGKGEVVELGPWLGRSTSCILRGLTRNSNFSGKLRVFDDFVWRARWMNNFVEVAEQLENHRDFRHLFEKYTADFKEHMIVEQRKITTYDGNGDIPQLEWTGGPVEILYVDCGRLYHTNEAWYELFSNSFIPDSTLIVMQDWGLQFEVPVRWENQTKNFTDSKGKSLQLVHELKNGTLATFLYRITVLMLFISINFQTELMDFIDSDALDVSCFC